MYRLIQLREDSHHTVLKLLQYNPSSTLVPMFSYFQANIVYINVEFKNPELQCLSAGSYILPRTSHYLILLGDWGTYAMPDMDVANSYWLGPIHIYGRLVSRVQVRLRLSRIISQTTSHHEIPTCICILVYYGPSSGAGVHTR